MNQPTQNVERMMEIAGNPRAKAIMVALVILTVIVVLQVNKLNQNQPMCNLFDGCKLRSIDVHRIQIALSKSGLSDFQVENDTVIVPKQQQADYLQAIAEHNAIPTELQQNQEVSPVSNPFLSRSQQLSIEREAKKKQIQQMVVRLPFVDQAWFEMDEPASHSAFNPIQKSAVISIRPSFETPLMDQNIDTIRQMIGGAIAGIDPGQIVVIDLTSGFAHRHSVNPSEFDHAIIAQRVAHVRQQLLEKRIKNALQKYPGLKITVVVDDKPADNKVARLAKTEMPSGKQRWVPVRVSAGANGQATIEDFAPSEPNESNKIQLVTALTPITDYAEPAFDRATRKQVSVFIEVPEKLLVEIYGDLKTDHSGSSQTFSYNGKKPDSTQKYFAHLKSDLAQIIHPIINSDQNFGSANISYSLLENENASAHAWTDQVKSFASDNWPSIGVLFIGLMLISLITQSSKKSNDWDDRADANADVVSIQSRQAPDQKGDDKRDAEVRLSRLIEKDPDTAAKVIESWIRDAA